MMGARPSVGGLRVCLCLLLGAAPAAAKDVYTLALPTYLNGCAPASRHEERVVLAQPDPSLSYFYPLDPHPSNCPYLG